MDRKNGRCAVLLPKGILSRLAEAEIRRRFVETDLVDCVISVGKNLFFNSPMEACVMICRTNKPTERKDKILFIEAKRFVERKNGETMMTQEHINAVAQAYLDFESVPGLSYVATNEEVRRNADSMSVSLYVKGTEEGDKPELLKIFSNLLNGRNQVHRSAVVVDAFKKTCL